MQRTTVGIVFICIAAFLYGIRYICAAILGSSAPSWNRSLFQEMLDSVGNGPLILSILSLIIGLIYFITAEFGQYLTTSVKQIKDNWNEFEK